MPKIDRTMWQGSATNTQGRAVIEFTMVGGGASPAVLTDGEDSAIWVASNSHAATGVYPIVLNCAGSTLKRADVSIRSTAAKLYPVAQWDSTTKTLTVRVYDLAETLTALSADEVLEVGLVFKDSF